MAPDRPIDLMIVGAPKSGTTSLKSYLGQHPGIATHSQREFVFFTNDEAYSRGYGRVRDVYFADARPGQALVGKSVVMMYSPAAMQRLKQHNPRVQVALIVRDPVARAYSDYWNAKRRGRETAATFEAAMRRCMATADADPARADAYVARGEYARFLEPIVAAFPREQLSVIVFERFAADPVAACQALFGRLGGLDDSFSPTVERRENPSAEARSTLLLGLMADRTRWRGLRRAVRSVVSERAKGRIKSALQRINDREFSPPPMQVHAKQELAEHFRPWNRRLAEALELNLDHWTAPG